MRDMILKFSDTIGAQSGDYSVSSMPGDPILLPRANLRAAAIGPSPGLKEIEALREAQVLGRGSKPEGSHSFYREQIREW